MIVSCVLLFVEAAGIVFVVGHGSADTLWIRALSCLALAVPASAVGLVLLMHSPPYFGFHVFWILTATGLLFAVCALGGLLRLLLWWNGR